jgi:hypothetical protein
MLFNVAVIVYLIYCGDKANSLHSSAMAWSYLTNIGILVGLGFSSLAGVLTLGRDPQK